MSERLAQLEQLVMEQNATIARLRKVEAAAREMSNRFDLYFSGDHKEEEDEREAERAMWGANDVLAAALASKPEEQK